MAGRLRILKRQRTAVNTMSDNAVECQPDTPYKHGPEYYHWIGICERCGLYRYEVWHYLTKRGEICHGTP